MFVSELGTRSENVVMLKWTASDQINIFIPNCFDGLFVLLSVQEWRIHVKHPLIRGGGLLWVVQSSAAIHVGTVHFHGIHGSVRVWARAGWLCILNSKHFKIANIRDIPLSL